MLWFMKQGLSFETFVIYILVFLLMIFIILPLHEWAHGYVAYLMGDKTAKYNGRLTLHPIAHIDPIGAVCLILFGFGWAKPVPVDSRNFKNPKLGMLITALAGPLSNFLSATFGVAILKGLLVSNIISVSSMIQGSFITYILRFIIIYVYINVLLGVFNLLPIPPLDGSKVLEAFLPNRILYRYYEFQARYQMFIFIGIFFLIRLFSSPIFYLMNSVGNFIYSIFGLPNLFTLGVI